MVRVVCPAKLNLYLSVSPPQENGYHLIHSEFQAISLMDLLEIELSDGPRTTITCDWPQLPAENTMTKALGRMQELIDIPPLRIHLSKRIPSEAGLGGGSSDAAGIIRGVLALLRTELPWQQDFAMAASIGADVPFFLHGGRAKVTGIGTEIEPLPDTAARHFLVVKPNVGVSTHHAYRRLDESRGNFRWQPHDTGNDFELISPEECRFALAALKESGATIARLTGSGSAVFGEFPSESDANGAVPILANFGETYVCRSLTRAESLSTVQ